MSQSPNKTKTNDTKISPYLNNYGQVIVNEKIDKEKIKEYSEKLKKFFINNKNKFDDNFKKIILNNELQSEFNYIELFRALKMIDIERSLSFLEFRYRFGLSSKNLIEINCNI